MKVHVFNFVKKIVIVLAVLALLLLVFIPLYWVIRTAFAPPQEAWSLLLPKTVTLNNFINVLFSGKPQSMAEVVGIYTALTSTALQPLMNSTLVAIFTAGLSIFISVPAAYALARFSFKGKTFVSVYLLFAYVFPYFILMVPIAYIAHLLNLLNNLFALALVHLTYAVPFSTYMLRGYFMGIPKDVEEQGLIDGCTILQVILRITIPLAMPGLVTVFLFSFTLSWGDIIFSMVLLRTSDKYTLPLYMNGFLWGGEITDPGALSAVTVIAGLIPSVLFMITQKYVRMGLVAGAVKA
ncbi:MAG: carbohydrate ABC transporter permease [Thaumarchaeota archaeon]|nr:carbohydrate ABC transporter permease [Nitrososphaerota archaeon]